jgi:hypothetical protein
MAKTAIQLPQEAISNFCAKYHVRKLSIFGSALTKDFGPNSDVDVLVEFEPEQAPGFLGIARMERELSELFGGRKVDLRTPEDLSEYFRDRVVNNALVQYSNE